LKAKFIFFTFFFIQTQSIFGQNFNLIREKNFHLESCDSLRTSWNQIMIKNVNYYHSFRYSRCWVFATKTTPYEGYFKLQIPVDSINHLIPDPSLHIELCKTPIVGETYYLGFRLLNGGNLNRRHKKNPVRIGFTNDTSSFDSVISWQSFKKFHQGNGVYAIPIVATKQSQFLRMEFKHFFSWVSYNIDSISITSPNDRGCSDWFLGAYTQCENNQCITEIDIPQNLIFPFDTLGIQQYLDSIYSELARVKFKTLTVLIKDFNKNQMTYTFEGRKKATYISEFLSQKQHCGATWKIEDLRYNVNARSNENHKYRLVLRFEYLEYNDDF